MTTATAAPAITVTPVRNKAELHQFIKLPWRLYAGDPNWVPPLIQAQLDLLDRRKNPFFQHSEAEYFLARRGDEVVGRIAAIHNRKHVEFHQEQAGFFGFFEAVQDDDVARALFDAARDWAKQRGLTILRGPMNFSTNDECGFLLEGFDSPPYIMMTYTKAYYLDFAEKYGFRKAKDLYAWLISKETFRVPEKFQQRIDSIKQQAKIRIRTLNMKDFRAEVDRIKTIYNKAWERNWGFVPMTDAEFEHMAKEFKAIVIPELVVFAEVDGQPVGFVLALPDANQAIKHTNGKLFPFGIFKLMYHLRKVRKLRVITLGVIPEFRQVGLGPVLYAEIAERGLALGYNDAEMSWTLEDNESINKPMQMIGGKLYKKYRIVEIDI